MGEGSAAVHHGAGSILDRLLDVRGIERGAARDAFLRPVLGHLQHPKAMHGMRAAADVICAAVRARKRIAIYGDYDVDGVMATAILWHMLRTVAPALEVRTYVPHRIDEGYGLNAEALRMLRAEGIELVITVDCGVSAIAEATLARELGLELVITDHHELKPSGEVPVAAAVVHPRLPGEQRFGELCGAGVAWKLAWMIGEVWCGSSRQPDVFRSRLVELAPLAAMGTIADVVPLIGENRVLVARGLPEIGRTRIPGMDALLSASRVEPKEVDTEQIMFRVAPRINASGRMGHAKDAIELFTTAGTARAREIVDMLGSLNDRRKKDERAIFDEARGKLRELNADAKPRGIVLHDEQWNLGIVGIVCSKLVDLHACPVVLITRNGEGYKGSGRSVRGIELHRVLASCAEHLSGFGGHAMAAGVHLTDVAQIEAFRRRFIEECDRLLPPEDEQKPVLEIDCACRLDEISSSAVVTELESLAPFGRDNRKPMFLIEGVEVTQTRVFGKTSATVPSPPHLELVVKQRAGARDAFLRIQWWGAAEHAAGFTRGSIVDLVVEVGLSAYSRMAEVEARLVDIRESVAAHQEALA
jgi:single-stranded-DNA-specific exonuclease